MNTTKRCVNPVGLIHVGQNCCRFYLRIYTEDYSSRQTGDILNFDLLYMLKTFSMGKYENAADFHPQHAHTVADFHFGFHLS